MAISFRAMGIRFLVSLVLLVLCGNFAFAQQPAFETAARNAILIDAKSGKVFFEKNADEEIPPASMSKLMTMIMVFEALKAGKLSLDQEFVVTEDAWRRGGASSGGSTMYAELNSSVKLRDLIQGVIIQSANDACITIAEGMAGDEATFAARMTARARELGLKNAVFKNATGLPDPEHRMSVRELSILAKYIIDNFPEYYKYYSQPDFTWNKIRQQNRNPLLADYPGADGMKTGYTKEAGYGLTGSAVREGRRLIMVIAGLQTIKDRKQEAQKLLDWGFGQFKTISVYSAGDKVGQARVWGGDARWVDLVTPQDVHLMLSPDEQANLEVQLHYTGPLLAPVKSGDKVGFVRFASSGQAIAEVPLQSAGSVSPVESMWQRALDSVLIMVFGG